MNRTAEEIEKIKLQSKLVKRFNKACANYHLIEDGDTILIGVSGGKDSLALIELMGRRAKIHVPKFTVKAVHVRVTERNYLTDISLLEDFCQQWDVPLIVADTQIGEEKGDKDPCFLCSWYRRKKMFELAKTLGCNKIALGHHLDDMVQTTLMNLIFQGSFGGIAPCLQMDKMPIQMIRPLCLIEEKHIARYAELSSYPKQVKLCPFEKESSRTDVKNILTTLEKLNPHVKNSVWEAMEKYWAKKAQETI
jgi:tRNA(Ile)-lysidine synthase TilS/MesJ